MPIVQFSFTIQKILMCLPSTYGTYMIHNQYLNGVLKEFTNKYGIELTNGLKDSFDLNLKFSSLNITSSISFIIIILTTILLIGTYIIINLRFNKHKLGS